LAGILCMHSHVQCEDILTTTIHCGHAMHLNPWTVLQQLEGQD
jgi:hypothetical protein